MKDAEPKPPFTSKPKFTCAEKCPMLEFDQNNNPRWPCLTCELYSAQVRSTALNCATAVIFRLAK